MCSYKAILATYHQKLYNKYRGLYKAFYVSCADGSESTRDLELAVIHHLRGTKHRLELYESQSVFAFSGIYTLYTENLSNGVFQ